MRIEKTECSYQVIECDLKFEEQITLDGELLIPISVLDKIKAEIEPKCDRINSLASALPYTAHREIQELLCEIMDLCKAEREVEECIKNG